MRSMNAAPVIWPSSKPSSMCWVRFSTYEQHDFPGLKPNGIPPKEPPSRPQTECHLERYEARPYKLNCLPWHHTRPLTHLPKPLPHDARKTLLQKQPPQEAVWYELGRVPPHHEDDGNSTMSLRGGVLLSCLGPFHASHARRHNVK